MKKLAKQLVGVTMILAAAAACDASPTGPGMGHDAPLPGEWEPVGGGPTADTILIDAGSDWSPSVEIEASGQAGAEPESARTR